MLPCVVSQLEKNQIPQSQADLRKDRIPQSGGIGGSSRTSAEGSDPRDLNKYIYGALGGGLSDAATGEAMPFHVTTLIFFCIFVESTTHTNTHERVGGAHRFRQGHTCFLRVRLLA